MQNHSLATEQRDALARSVVAQRDELVKTGKMYQSLLRILAVVATNTLQALSYATKIYISCPAP